MVSFHILCQTLPRTHVTSVCYVGAKVYGRGRLFFFFFLLSYLPKGGYETMVVINALRYLPVIILLRCCSQVHSAGHREGRSADVSVTTALYQWGRGRHGSNKEWQNSEINWFNHQTWTLRVWITRMAAVRKWQWGETAFAQKRAHGMIERSREVTSVHCTASSVHNYLSTCSIKCWTHLIILFSHQFWFHGRE